MNSRATSATGQHALMDSLELSLRNLRDCWPEPWPGLALVFDRCVQRLGWSADGSSPRLQALTRAAHAIAAEIERDGRARMQQGREPEYHNRLHIADTLVCMTHLLLAHRQARPAATVKADAEYLGLVVMLGHDFLHSGQVNRFPGELESLAVSQLQPILRQYGVQPEDIETIGHCILKTDPTGVRQSHELIVGRPFVLDDRDCLVVLVDEADILASTLPVTALSQTERLAHEWSLLSLPSAKTLLQPASRIYFLEKAALFSSPAANLLGINDFKQIELSELHQQVASVA